MKMCETHTLKMTMMEGKNETHMRRSVITRTKEIGE